jgi:hypothetical protein
MNNRKSVPEMLVECLREAAVLTAVFIPLDRVMTGEPLTIGWYLTILGTSGGLLILGIGLELQRKQ